MNNLEITCPCGTGLKYGKCCHPFHEGAIPKTPVQLMRSRYTAYVLNLPDYIVKTTHPASPQYSDNKFSWKRKISQFATNSTFQKLEILDSKEKNSLGTVVFTCYILQDGQDASFTEKSYFEKIKDRWFYRGGQLQSGSVPNMITTGELRVLPLAYYDEQILRKKAAPILEISDDIKTLVEEMIETMDACNGIGLAAPQVHHSIRLFVIRTPIEENLERLGVGDVQVFINPTLSSPSKDTWKAPEGCLSIPTIGAEVERPKEITVEYMNLDGIIIKKQFFGWAARVIMHENDHLNGVLFIDRLDSEEKEKLKPLLKNLNERIHNNNAL